MRSNGAGSPPCQVGEPGSCPETTLQLLCEKGKKRIPRTIFLFCDRFIFSPRHLRRTLSSATPRHPAWCPIGAGPRRSAQRVRAAPPAPPRSATLVLALHTVLANPPLAPIAGESATLKLDVFARVPGWARRARADRSSEDHRFARRTRDAPHVTWPRSRCASRLRAFAEGTKERLQVHRGCRRILRGADALRR